MASRLLRNTDTGAPQLSGNAPGSLIGVLKTALVNGYGSVAPLGWSIAFDDILNSRCVFRPGGGTSIPFIRIDDNGLANGTFQYAQCIMYETMSDVNTGISACPPSDNGDHRSIVKCSTDVSDNIPWIIIGDELGFWILLKIWVPAYGEDYNYGWFWQPHYVGAWTCIEASNIYNWMTILHDSDGYNHFDFLNGSNICHILRDPETLEIGSKSFALWAKFNNMNTVIGQSNTGRNASPRNGRYFYEPIGISVNDSYMLGAIPGFFNMIWRDMQIYDLNINYYNISDANKPLFFDIGVNNQMMVFTFRCISYNGLETSYGHNNNRGSILIGEGFRNAY